MRVAEHPSVVLDAGALLGTWRNTNAASRGIVRIDIARDREHVVVQAFGAAEPEPCDWGRAHARLYATDAETTEALAFEATYDHGFLEVHLQANVKAGVLVVASLNRFVDDSGRSSYFTREFYYRPGRHQGLRP